MTRIALVNLASLPMPGNEPIFPIGLRCVQDALDRAHHETRLVDFVEDPGAVEDLRWATEGWDIIGFTIRNIDPIDLACDGHVEHYQRFVARLREAVGEPAPLFVGGGPGYSLFAESLLARLGFDVGVVGPGEQAMLGIAADPESYRGRAGNLAGERYPGFLVNPLSHRPSLMAAYARTDRAMIGVETRRKTCYQGCVYCPYAYLDGDNDGDLKPQGLIAEELREIHRSGIRRVFFTDAIFNSELRYAKKVVATITEQDLPGLTWSAYFTPKPFDDEFAALLGASGVEYVVVSPDSLDDRVMKLLGKSFDTRHVGRCIERSRANGLQLKVNVVFGGPGEDRQSVRTTARYANEHLAADEFIMSLGYRVLPGTALARQLSIDSADLVDPTFYPFDPELFSWIVEDFDDRFLTPGVMLNLMAGRVSSRQMSRIPLRPGTDASRPAPFSYLALTRDGSARTERRHRP